MSWSGLHRHTSLQGKPYHSLEIDSHFGKHSHFSYPGSPALSISFACHIEKQLFVFQFQCNNFHQNLPSDSRFHAIQLSLPVALALTPQLTPPLKLTPGKLRIRRKHANSHTHRQGSRSNFGAAQGSTKQPFYEFAFCWGGGSQPIRGALELKHRLKP